MAPHATELAEQVRAGAEKIITKNGEGYIALIDAERLDYYHCLERERIHLLSMRHHCERSFQFCRLWGSPAGSPEG